MYNSQTIISHNLDEHKINLTFKVKRAASTLVELIFKSTEENFRSIFYIFKVQKCKSSPTFYAWKLTLRSAISLNIHTGKKRKKAGEYLVTNNSVSNF